MKHRRPVAVLTVCGAVLFTLSACSSGDDDAKPATWAHDVCTATTSWVTSMQKASPKDGNLGSTPQEARTTLVTFFGESGAITSNYVSRVEKAGTPGVTDGDAISKEFAKSIRSVKSAFDAATVKAQKLSVNDENALNRQIQELNTEISSQPSKIGTAFQSFAAKHKKGGNELKKAFKGQRSCADVPT
jgi:hypothetical protein